MKRPTLADVMRRLDAIERRITALEKDAHPQAVMTPERMEEIIRRAVGTVSRAHPFGQTKLCDRRIC